MPASGPDAGPVWPARAIGVAAIAGVGLFWWQFARLWQLWTTDPLRSVGMLVIPVSVILAARALRSEDFANGGSWWGLLPVVLAFVAASLQAGGRFVFRLGYFGGPNLVSTGIVFCLYASGVVLLLGGRRACRKAAFPLFLLLFVNPVPGFFSNLVDLPMQHFGANVARSFATLLHVPLSGSRLDLMFYNGKLGMFIAPGCNGLQGAVAMGGLALVIGHLRRLRFWWHALFVVIAVGLAYLFNLLRLCSLVLYYCAADRFPALGAHAVGADYAIGGTLFMLAAAFLFWGSRPRRRPA